MEDILAISLIFGGGTLFLLSVSPIGKAVADRIRGRTWSADSERTERLEESQAGILDELDLLKQIQIP